MSTDGAAGYLAGMIDGEGTVAAYGPVRGIYVSNSDKALTDACREACLLLGIEARVSGPYAPRPGRHHQMWRLNITGRANLGMVAERVPIRSAAKRERLARALATYRFSGYVRRHEIPAERLRQRRAEGRSQRAIAAELGVHQGTISRWCRLAGIA